MQPLSGNLEEGGFYFDQLVKGVGVTVVCCDVQEGVDFIFDLYDFVEELVLGFVADFCSEGFSEEAFSDKIGEASAGGVAHAGLEVVEFGLG